MDGVITDTMPFHFIAWQKVFRTQGIELEEIEVYEREGEQGQVSISVLLAKHGRHVTPEEQKGLLEEKERIFKEISHPKLFPCIDGILQDLKKRGFKLGLVTGTSRDEVKKVIPGHVMGYFAVMVTGDSVATGKPSPEPYLKAIDLLNIDPRDAVVIENAPYGITSAKRAGIFCIAITTYLPKAYLKDADLILDSLEEIKGSIPGEVF